MADIPLRLVFQARNRRGLGHLMRGLNIAREVRHIAPSCQITFYTRNEAGISLCEPHGRCVVERDLDGFGGWPTLVRSLAPDAIIYDTMIPTGLALHPADVPSRTVYIMRKSKAEQQQRIFDDPFLAQADLILVPHTPEEFGYELPAALAAKSAFVGPIVRPLSQEAQASLRERYCIGAQDFLLVSSPGGGGFAEDAASFFEVVLDVQRRLAPAMPNLRHLVVLGPNSDGTFQPQPGMTVVGFEPELVNLFALADLVIAEGGYNSVNEIRLAGTPAAFLPGARTYDDQEERVRGLERSGLARVFEQRDTPFVAQQITALCMSRAELAEMRLRYAGEQMATGNRAAAQQIVELVVEDIPYGCV